MVMDVNLLTDMFAGPPTDDEPTVIDYMAIKWRAFFGTTSVLGSTAVDGVLGGADTAFRSALVGVSASGAGAQKMQDAMSAFWSAAIAIAPTVWITVPLIAGGSGVLPGGLGGMAASLQPVFDSNTASALSLSASAAALGPSILGAQSGGTVNLVPPPPGGTLFVPIL